MLFVTNWHTAVITSHCPTHFWLMFDYKLYTDGHVSKIPRPGKKDIYPSVTPVEWGFIPRRTAIVQPLCKNNSVLKYFWVLFIWYASTYHVINFIYLWDGSLFVIITFSLKKHAFIIEDKLNNWYTYICICFYIFYKFQISCILFSTEPIPIIFALFSFFVFV